ncbi:MAG: hypothetical protein ACRC0X_07605 [Brevinema sp.]
MNYKELSLVTIIKYVPPKVLIRINTQIYWARFDSDCNSPIEGSTLLCVIHYQDSQITIQKSETINNSMINLNIVL